jgi:hypothetical protein
MNVNPTKKTGETNAQEAVLVSLTASYSPLMLATLEAMLSAAIKRLGVGEFDGDEVALQSEGVTLYMYGPDAEALFAAIKEILRSSPLCRGARIILRNGGPGTLQREVSI